MWLFRSLVRLHKCTKTHGARWTWQMQTVPTGWLSVCCYPMMLGGWNHVEHLSL